ncbi:mitochondrial ATPase expression-domain-containing protein [Aspergillus egyptiacus]|nr:mitochondrial ATPase expression-domain-containing protein [Aspergillus egyptiacus]
MAALLEPAYKELVASMPQSAFVEALHLLSPDYFVEPYKAVYAPLHPHSTEVKMHRSLELIFDDFARNLSAIIRGRRSAGHKLGLAEYTHLLDCARSSGDALMADYVWHAMKKDKVVPDIRCYNHYMEVKVWNRSYSGLEKFRLRVTPFSYRRRRFQDPGWQGYGTARYSVRKEVREIFDEMTQAGYEGNEASIVSLFMASARVGHVPGMKKILKTVWNVDVNALNAGVRDPVAEHDRSSPLHPTDHLLYAVAHGFSTNNDIASALKIIEHISDSYDLVVPSRVWRELFERSFVLSRPRYGSEVKRDTKGKVTFDFVKGLFETMVQEPFNIVPTVDMLSKMARNAWSSRKLDDYLHHMRAAYKILDETRRKRHAARTMVESYFLAPRLGNKQLDPRVLRSRGFADAVHAYGILRLHVMQQTVLMERLARKLVTRGNWTPDSPYWDRMGLPRALEEWRDFLPQHFDCRARNYNITFEGSTHFGAAWYPAHSKFQVRRPSLNDEFTLDETANEREDDFFWNRWRDNMHEDDLSFPLLKRIFDPMRPDLDLNSFRSASMRPSKGLREAASKRLKEGEFSWTFGKLGEPDPA